MKPVPVRLEKMQMQAQTKRKKMMMTMTGLAVGRMLELEMAYDDPSVLLRLE
jgi:hypothetical protein